MSVFKKIIETSINEDALRSNAENITNSLLRNFLTKEIEYDSTDNKIKSELTPNIVLTSSSEKQTVTDNDFNMEFSKKTFDLLTYINWNNVAVAGGSIVNILTKSTNKLNDIDLFIYDLDLENAKLKIDHIINAIKQKASDLKYETRIYIKRSPAHNAGLLKLPPCKQAISDRTDVDMISGAGLGRCIFFWKPE